MALFDKLFTKRKLKYDNHEARKRDRSYQITSEQVRLLLFKECDWRGRKLLFDSSTIEKLPAGKHDKANRHTDETPCILEVADGFAYVYKGPAADASLLGEMIFGAVAINYNGAGVSLKIHIMDDPRRLMCTKVFCVPTSRRISRSRVERKTSTGAANSSSSLDIGFSSVPQSVPVPALREDGVSLNLTMDRGDSGFCGDQSPYSSVSSTYDYFFDVWDENDSKEDVSFHSPPGRKLSSSSNGSWQRRTFHNLITRFDLGPQRSSSHLLSVPTSSSSTATRSDSQVSTSASGTNASLSSSVANLPHRRNKLGLALLITVADCADTDEVRRCLEHSSQLAALVCRLRLATLSAGAGAGNRFVSTLHAACCDAATWLSDLLYGPRLQPAWLALVTAEPRLALNMADTLLSDLCSVLSVGDTKHTNFFISTLLTHVLTFHLGWVTTVSPYDTPHTPVTPDPQHLAANSSQRRRPYNALWAQLGDLCGTIGFPPRTARTIINGNANLQFINRLLLVLAYFVRSGDVKRAEFQFEEAKVTETRVLHVTSTSTLKRSTTVNKMDSGLLVPTLNTQSSDHSVSSLGSDVTVKRSPTFANIDMLSTYQLEGRDGNEPLAAPAPGAAASGQLRRNHTTMLPLTAISDSSLSSSSEEFEQDQNVVFVLGDDEKLVGLKNKSANGKCVKKSSKVQLEPIDIPGVQKSEDVKEKTEVCPEESCDSSKSAAAAATATAAADSPSKCCGQTLTHSKPIKHSGFKFEFDKYPKIVTNYMKSKNLEILDRHYIGKPGNLKLASSQFDPTVVPPIQEERCETCYKCQQMESMLQTPTNASEMEYMNDMPRQSEPQYANETTVSETNNNHREISPKSFVRKRKENTVVINIARRLESPPKVSVEALKKEKERDKELSVQVRQVIEFPMPAVNIVRSPVKSGFDVSLLGGVSDHYVPDLILQGTTAGPQSWERELRRDLELTAYLHRSGSAGAGAGAGTGCVQVQAVAIVGDTNTWEVKVVGRECGASGMSSLVGAMLDAVPAMKRARVPSHQCLSFLESKLRELCVLSKTLADMLMSRDADVCDMATLTTSLNIDVTDVPLLLAVATTHTPLLATRYGITYTYN